MPAISLDELGAVLMGALILLATGFLNRAGQDAWRATRRRLARRTRPTARRSHRR